MLCNCGINHAGIKCHSCSYEGCLDSIVTDIKICWKCDDKIEREMTPHIKRFTLLLTNTMDTQKEKLKTQKITMKLI